MKSISISLLGDERYRDALGVVAKRKNRNIGDMVREAIDARFGHDIEEALSFFASDIEYTQHSERMRNETEQPHA